MVADNRELREVFVRLETLERQNRRFKQTCLAVLFIGATLLAMAQTRSSGVATATKVVTATKFVLTDSAGRERAILDNSPIGPRFVMQNDKGAPTAELWGNDDPELFMLGGTISAYSFQSKDSAGRNGASLGFFPVFRKGSEESAIAIPGRGTGYSTLLLGGDKPQLFLASGKGSIFAGVSDEGRAGLSLSDRDGFETDLGSTDLITTVTGEKHATSAASVVLIGKGKEVLWSAPH